MIREQDVVVFQGCGDERSALGPSISHPVLFNSRVISMWMKSPTIDTLPELTIELFLDMPDEPKWRRYHGEHYLGSQGESTYGIRMECKFNYDFIDDLLDMIGDGSAIEVFPFEFYTIEFWTFANQAYTSYLKPFRYLFVDNTVINSDKALRFIVTNTFRKLGG